MKIYGATSSPIPPSGITRISLWRHGMERPKLISSHPDGFTTLNDCFRDMETERSLFNVNIIDRHMLLGMIESDLQEIAHRAIPFPSTGGTCFSGKTEKGSFGLYMMLAPSDPTHYAVFINEPSLTILDNSIKIARCFLENGLSESFCLESGTVLDLVRLGRKAGMSFGNNDVETLVKLASLALREEKSSSNILRFPAPTSFEHSEYLRDKKCSFGFNIVRPEKFPYPAQAVSIAIRTFLGSRSWDPKKVDIVLEPLKLPSKDGERVIHITAKEISGSRTELSFCIRRPLEHESTAPIKGRIIFRE